uniref:Uncharacterized protein n=1 Tax=Oryza barthii TaxID=65489 RepID=A0A0D3FH52_9ORYZ
MPPSPGSPPAKSGEEASGWWNGAGWWLDEVGRRRGLGVVWWKLRAAICPCGGSELMDGDLQSRQKPSSVVHRADSGYAFGRHNLLVALSRVTLSLSCRAFLGENHIFLDGPGFSFGQNWRGGRRVVEQRGLGLALRGGGSMKSVDEGASVWCGGCYVLPFVCVVVLSWWTATCSQGCRVPGESLVRWFTGPAAATSSGVVTYLGHCRGLPSPFLDELLWIGDGGILDVVTTLVASFSEPRLCGVAVGLAAFGHA